MKKIYFSLLFFIATADIFAQITVTQYPTVQQVTAALQGNNTTVSNLVIHCPNLAIGLINATNSNLGMGNGLALCTGTANSLASPNNDEGTSWNFFTDGDSDLATLAGVVFSNTHDACMVELDIVPAYDNLNFQFVFGSEDYPETNNPQWQDVCAVLVSGNGISGKQNIAVVPGTSTIVSAGTIDSTNNPSLFVNNRNGTTVQYDGFTTLLNGTAATVPQNTYHLKIGIVDLGDAISDSGLMIGGLGFYSTAPSGISELTASAVSVFPNPVSETAVIDLTALSGNPYSFRLFDASGRLILNQTSNDTHFVFSRNNLPSGIYFSEVTGNTGTYRNKLILN